MKRFLMAVAMVSQVVAAEVEIIQPLASQAYGELRCNEAVEGGKLTIGGVEYEKGWGTHAVSEIPVNIEQNKGIKAFTGAVGVNDRQGPGKGMVKFRILSGSDVLWESKVHHSGMPAEPFRVEMAGKNYKRLYLQADDLGENAYDHANWVDLKWETGEEIAVTPSQEFTGEQFGIVPGKYEDQTPAFRKAIQAMREAPGSILTLTKGEYHFFSQGALKRHFHISNHDQPTWQPVSLSLDDLSGVTINGQGSLFLFHGTVQPILIMDSDRLTLSGIRLDYAIPRHSQGLVTKVDNAFYEVTVDMERYPHEIRDGWFVFKGLGWEAVDRGVGIVFDGKTHEIVAGTSDYNFRGKLTQLEPGLYRVEKNIQSSGIKVGDILTFRQGWQRPHPAVVMYRAKSVELENFVIYSSHGMGVLAQRSENITIKGGGVYPRAEVGRYFSTSADATHFSNCKGKITVEGGLYEGMMDDAINVHATCLRIEERVDDRTLRCRYMHGQSVGFETFLVGERLSLIQAKWLQTKDFLKVTGVRKLSTTELLLSFDEDVPAEIVKGDAVENKDWFPSVEFRKNVVKNNRARGALLTTPRFVDISNNTFESIAGSAILLAGDANGWYESGGCNEVMIRANRFYDNLTSRFQFTEALISIFPEIPDLEGQKEAYHRNVSIVDNDIRTFDVPLLFAMSTNGLVFQGNTIKYHDRYPSWNKPKYILKKCDKTSLQE